MKEIEMGKLKMGDVFCGEPFYLQDERRCCGVFISLTPFSENAFEDDYLLHYLVLPTDTSSNEYTFNKDWLFRKNQIVRLLDDKDIAERKIDTTKISKEAIQLHFL